MLHSYVYLKMKPDSENRINYYWFTIFPQNNNKTVINKTTLDPILMNHVDLPDFWLKERLNEKYFINVGLAVFKSWY